MFALNFLAEILIVALLKQVNMKKAALNISLMEIIGLIIGSMVIITLIFFVMGISDLFKNNPEQAMYDNYNILITSINDLVKGQEGTSLTEFPDKRIEKETQIVPVEKNAVQVVIPLYIQDGFGIIIFDKDTVFNSCKSNLVAANKPKECQNLPCICLSKINEWIMVGFTECKTIDNVQYASATPESLGNYGGEHGLGVLGKDIALRSFCNDNSNFKFYVKNVKIIKFPSGVEGKYNLLFHITD